MRPIDKGSSSKVYPVYQEARDDLIQRIGDYCSYCENALHSDIDVEHVKPKSHFPTEALNWDNFLLACTYCNSIKGDTSVELAEYLWPDRDNTFLAFDYPLHMPPMVRRTNAVEVQRIAQQTIELTGLDRLPGHPKFSHRDRRHIKRNEVWGIAILSLNKYREDRSLQLLDSIILNAISRGFWSIWMTVFADFPEIRERLINAFPGTSKSCFASSTHPIPRNGGVI